MNALETAEGLHRQATEIIHNRGLDNILSVYGNVLYTGSYSLNVMAWPDIDISMVMDDQADTLDAFFEMGHKIAHLDGVFSLKFDDFVRSGVPGREELEVVYPRGLYWGGRMEIPGGGVPWKLDIWAVDSAEQARNRAMMQRYRHAMTDEARRLIVETKLALITSEGRTPMGSGCHIYDAILFEGMRAEEEIRAWLRQQGIRDV